VDAGAFSRWFGQPAQHGVELGGRDERTPSDADRGDLAAGDGAIRGGAADAEQLAMSPSVA
jgi:hypothetical protein